jgi:hypothetical protein
MERLGRIVPARWEMAGLSNGASNDASASDSSGNET